eukprot:2892734-Pyramimonas_sp.AAC.1
MSSRLRSFKMGEAMGPSLICRSNVVHQWCRAVGGCTPVLDGAQCVFENASGDLWRAERPRLIAAQPAHVYLLTLAEIGWRSISSRKIQLCDEEVRLRAVGGQRGSPTQAAAEFAAALYYIMVRYGGWGRGGLRKPGRSTVERVRGAPLR